MAGPPSLLERILTIAGAGVGGLGASASLAALGTQGPLALTMIGVAGAAVTAANALGGSAQRARANEVAAFVERLVEQQGEWRRGLKDLLTEHQIDLAALPVDHRENPLVQFALLLTGTQEQIIELLKTQASLAASLQRSVERQLPEIAAHAKLTLQNVRAILLAQKQQVQRMDAFALDLGAIRESTARRPTLTLPQASEVENNEVSNPFIFSERFVPLVGRDDLMQRLHAFLEKPQISSKAANDRFAWWWLHGDGGSGKSRLAHELCIDARAAGWDAGRLETNEPFHDWRRWEIRRDTLMIIDYAGDRAEQTATIIDALAKDAGRFEHRVRVLLLDRARTDALDRRLKQGVTAGGQNAIARSEHVGASELPPLPPGDVEALIGFAHFWFKGEMPDLDRAFRVLTERIDPKPSEYDPTKTGRPWAPRALYACVLGYAIAQMGLDEVDAWDGDELLDWVLQEEQRHWVGAGVKPTHVNAAVLATLIGGLELPVNPESPYASLVPDTLPACGGDDLNGLAHMAGFTGVAPGSSGDVANAIPSLAPVTPDILGERFVLDRLRGSLCTDREPGHEAQRDTRALLNDALRTDPKSVTEFIDRALRDFPRHRASEDLWAPVVEEDLPPETRGGVLGLGATHLARVGREEDADRLLNRLEGLHDADPSSQSVTAAFVDVIHVVASTLAARAEYHRALVFVERALASDQHSFGAQHERVAQSLNACGFVMYSLGNAAGALERFREAERIDRAVFGDDSPNVAVRVNNVGSALLALGDASGALERYCEAERIDRSAFGDDHPNVATDVNNVGSALQALGDAFGALEQHHEAERIDRSVFGDDHPNVARDLNNIGSALEALGDASGALAQYREAERIDRFVFGDDHPKVAGHVHNIGGALLALGDASGALVQYREAERINRFVFGDDHPSVARDLSNVGSALQALGDASGALARHREAERIDRSIFGDDHPHVAADMSNVGGALQALGDASGALAQYRAAERINRSVFGNDHPKVATAVNNVGSALQALGDASGALVKYREAERIDRFVFGDDHPNLAIRVSNVGTALEALGDAFGALMRYREAERIDRAVLGDDHPDVAIRLNNIGTALRALGDASGARNAVSAALHISIRSLGPRHPNVVTVALNLTAIKGDPIAAARDAVDDEAAQALAAAIAERLGSRQDTEPEA